MICKYVRKDTYIINQNFFWKNNYENNDINKLIQSLAWDNFVVQNAEGV